MLPVAGSSNVLRIGYDEANNILYVDYISGSYIYMGVPKSMFTSLMSASSKGSYLSQNIKNRFSYERV